jgi:hypothetical protein
MAESQKCFVVNEINRAAVDKLCVFLLHIKITQCTQIRSLAKFKLLVVSSLKKRKEKGKKI